MLNGDTFFISNKESGEENFSFSTAQFDSDQAELCGRSFLSQMSTNIQRRVTWIKGYDLFFFVRVEEFHDLFTLKYWEFNHRIRRFLI